MPRRDLKEEHESRKGGPRRVAHGLTYPAARGGDYVLSGRDSGPGVVHLGAGLG